MKEAIRPQFHLQSICKHHLFEPRGCQNEYSGENRIYALSQDL